MKREIEKFEKNCDAIVQGIFETVVLPNLTKAARKIGVEKIDEVNNYYFLKVNGKEYIEREFCELGKKYEKFFYDYLMPINKSRYFYPKRFKFIF